MSPIFRHGRLRLYLLKLLDEAPRHGYEVIRLLQDRFMGVYSPSPGTIYPRLARLEEDGLVTHDEVDGRKVYRITEKGREEIRGRLDDLAELEDELTESVRDIAREVTEDVRDTVRSLREEITWAARDIRREGGGPGRGTRRDGPGTGRPAHAPGGAEHAPDGREDRAAGHEQERGTARDEDARRIREEARQAREEIRDTFRSRGDRKGPGSDRKGPGSDRRGRGSWKDATGGGRPGWQDWASMPAGLERMASDFAQELRSAAGRAGDIGEGALGDLRDILADTLARIRDEVFEDEPRAAGREGPPAGPGPAGDAGAGDGPQGGGGHPTG